MKRRRYSRHIYIHRLSLTLDNSFGRGEILDWSIKGIRISSGIPLESYGTNRVHLHVLQDRGLMDPLELWDKKGEIRWTSHQEDKWLAGIELDEPIQDLENACEKIDFCYLFFSSEQDLAEKSVE